MWPKVTSITRILCCANSKAFWNYSYVGLLHTHALLTVLPQNPSVYKDWYKKQPFRANSGDNPCIFQGDGAPCHKAKLITSFLGDRQTPRILIQSRIRGQSLKRGAPTNYDQLWVLIRQKWITINQNLAQKPISSMSQRTAGVIKKKGQHCKGWLFE